MRAAETLTAAQARRTAIAAQQLALPRRTDAINRGHLRRMVDAIGLLQIDSVNVLARAHYLPLFSRLGSYPTELLDGAAWPAGSGERMLLETWAHVASLVPMHLEPLLRWRRGRWSGSWLTQHREFADRMVQVLRESGPMSAGQIEKQLHAPGRGRAGWWEWSQTKRACEILFEAGVLGTAYRRGFERHYDLLDRIIPAAVRALPTPDPVDAIRQLVALAARHHGIGTARDLADYYRLPVESTKSALADLLDAGTVRRLAVQGWSQPAYLHRDARMPRRVAGSALLCPFDPLIWERARTERLFGTRYRIEIYVPGPRRVYGYYVFPLLLDDRIAGRFDLKADRRAGRLLVQASWVEPGCEPTQVAESAAVELRRMAAWLGLADVVVAPRGDLASTLLRFTI